MKKIAFEWWVQDRARGGDFSVPGDLGRCYAISLRQTDSFWIGSRQLLGPRSNGRNAALELYLQPRSAPLWFAQPARPRQGATHNSARAAVGGQQGGLSETAAGVVAYITIIPAIIFLVMEPYNRSFFIRFHAWQSIFFGITVAVVHFVLGVIPILGWILLLPVGLAFLILWIFVMIKASKGERYKIPFIGNFAEQAAK